MAVKTIRLDSQSFDIAYDIINPSAKNDLIILHGWGSNKEIMKQAFENTLSEFRHIYIDLPGFGKSSNDYVLTVYDYTKIIDAFLEKLGAKKFVVMGHSYGGKVATLLNPENLVLLSSAGIIEEKSSKVKAKIAVAKTLKAFGLGKITKVFRSKDVNQMSEHMYATFKNAIAENLENDFAKFKNKAYIFWGKTDTATSLASGQKIHSLIKDSEFKAYEQDHYFFLKNSNDIGNILRDGIL